MFDRPEVIIRKDRGLIKVRFQTDIGPVSGHAHCAPGDTLDEQFGFNLACMRAELKYIRLVTPQLQKQYDLAAKICTEAFDDMQRIAERNNALLNRWFELKTQIDTDLEL